jgi:hypothetical protein
MAKLEFPITARLYIEAARDYRQVTLAVEIDTQELAQWLGPRALRNKSRKAKVLGTAIVAKITEEPTS